MRRPPPHPLYATVCVLAGALWLAWGIVTARELMPPAFHAEGVRTALFLLAVVVSAVAGSVRKEK